MRGRLTLSATTGSIRILLSLFTILSLAKTCQSFLASISAAHSKSSFSHATKSASLRSMLSSSLSVKRAKLLVAEASSAVIGTHSGSFQADEAMGVWMLQQTPEFRNSKIVRSRDMKVLDTLDIVIDVGGVYDHATRKYDHHQNGYDERFEGDATRCTKLSASGLVYRHYGKEVLQAYYPELNDTMMQTAYLKIYDRLLEALDAIDTGVEAVPEGVRLLYKDSTGLASRVGRLNPRWNEVDANGQEVDPDARFAHAVELCGQDFLSIMMEIVESDIPARELVDRALTQRLQVDATGEILCLESGGLPWKNHLYELEKVYNVNPLVKFVLYTDQAGMWRVQAVTVEGMAFENRLSLPKEWCGLRDAGLEAVTKIPGCKFVHAAGFIGGHQNKEGALLMAKAALQR
ncbi:hypothetical protein MPSEU_000723900 [Mayamaea pseudoterrestris]|nr:hypothetical protein MPSEU_000723900 [Mayamaea pseudoterrestris]